ncbi:pyridine nucleotide transhydrogenase [Bowmanella dokdonensis]|uniref:Pyridine nucleotide transhydrogenase n=1 Tax=Bowmanella dokdonensis TaxID=751969 RepID=A0A939DT33_9ALTE|nr:pyridine nucleotide transhydrogenase [Bowmanella dokdonensis]MBN7827411.1 pyridine nucleotide transhydrogenase [Bowmanella dokdonensis]
MRKTIILTALLSASFLVQAEEGQNKLFDCVAADTLAVNNACVEQRISQNIHYREMQQDIYQQSGNLGDNAMATMRFFPEQYLIEIVAHRDALETAALVAANRK